MTMTTLSEYHTININPDKHYAYSTHRTNAETAMLGTCWIEMKCWDYTELIGTVSAVFSFNKSNCIWANLRRLNVEHESMTRQAESIDRPCKNSRRCNGGNCLAHCVHRHSKTTDNGTICRARSIVCEGNVYCKLWEDAGGCKHMRQVGCQLSSAEGQQDGKYDPKHTHNDGSASTTKFFCQSGQHQREVEDTPDAGGGRVKNPLASQTCSILQRLAQKSATGEPLQRLQIGRNPGWIACKWSMEQAICVTSVWWTALSLLWQIPPANSSLTWGPSCLESAANKRGKGPEMLGMNQVDLEQALENLESMHRSILRSQDL